jgi:WD40 repeat protein
VINILGTPTSKNNKKIIFQHEYESDCIITLKLLPNQLLLIIIRELKALQALYCVHIWSIKNGQIISSCELTELSEYQINKFEINDCFISCFENSKLFVYEMKNTQIKLKNIYNLKKKITSISFNYDLSRLSNFLAISTIDGFVLIISLATGVLLHRFNFCDYNLSKYISMVNLLSAGSILCLSFYDNFNLVFFDIEKKKIVNNYCLNDDVSRFTQKIVSFHNSIFSFFEVGSNEFYY